MDPSLSFRFPVGAAVTLAELDRDPHPLLARLRRGRTGLVAARARRMARHPARPGAAGHARRAAFTVDDPRFSTAQVIGPSMLSLDGRRTRRHRDPFARPFRPARTRARFTAFWGRGRPAGHRAGAGGQAELRGELAGPLAVAVVAEALGLGDATPRPSAPGTRRS